MDLSKLAEEVMDLSTKQPDGVIHDADTILADIMGAADFHISGISDDILKLYLEVENKDDFESLFYLMADEKLSGRKQKSNGRKCFDSRTKSCSGISFRF